MPSVDKQRQCQTNRSSDNEKGDVAERWHIFPEMGWGLPNRPGHHLDLASAIPALRYCLLP